MSNLNPSDLLTHHAIMNSLATTYRTGNVIFDIILVAILAALLGALKVHWETIQTYFMDRFAKYKTKYTIPSITITTDRIESGNDRNSIHPDNLYLINAIMTYLIEAGVIDKAQERD